MKQAENPILLKTIYFLLITITVAVYFPLYKNGFIGFDDHTYIYQNSVLQKGFSWEGVKFAFSLDNKTSYWHPLTWFSLMLDYQLWGVNPTGYHLENLLFHTSNGLLLFHFLRSTTGKTVVSAAIALIFLIHPTAVESVAWAVERKTVLSTFFFLAAIITHLRYSKAPTLGRYLLLFLLMTLGLMCKSMIITLPLLLLLLDIWPLGRWNIRSDGGPAAVIAMPLIIEKIPLMGLSVASVIISLLSHSASNIVDRTPITGRISHAIVSCVQHLGRIFWSSDHAVFYPVPSGHQPATIIASAGLLMVITITSIFFFRRYPWFFVGWFWYLIAFAPVSGLLRAGKWPGMADRFLYIPSIGIIIVICMAAATALEHKKGLKPLAVTIALAIAVLFGYQTNQQVRKWLDSATIFSDAVRINPKDGNAHYLLGRSLAQEKKDYPTAEEQLKIAVSLDPGEAYYKADLGGVYLSLGDTHKALPYLREAALVILSDPELFNSLGSAFLQTDDYTNAIRFLDKTLSLKPNHENARYNKGIVLYKQGKFQEARNTFEALLQTNPGNADARTNLGMTLIDLKEYDLAIKETEQVLKAIPTDENAWVNLGIALERKGERPAALSAYQKALSIAPGLAEARDGIARLSHR